MLTYLSRRAWIGLAVLVVVLLFQHRGSAFIVPIHLDITRSQLTEVRDFVGGLQVGFGDAAIEEILTANKATDDAPNYDLNHPELHFTNEKFSDSVATINQAVDDIVMLLTQSPPDGSAARQRLGRALHTLQDFYAHSNWVELGRTTFFPATLTDPASSLKVCEDTNANALLDGTGRLETSGYFKGGFNPLTPATTGCRDLPAAGKCWHGNYLNACPGINKDYGTAQEAFDNLPSSAQALFTLSDIAPPRSTHADAKSLAGRHTYDFITNTVLPRIHAACAAPNCDVAIGALLDAQGTITFVVDDTGSMTQEIDGVKAVIVSLANSVVRAPLNWQLVLFNDLNLPTDPIPQRWKLFPTAAALAAAVNGIVAHEGGDCPELSQNGLQQAVSHALPGGQIFVFTDADAKDAPLATTVIQNAHDKNIVLNYGLTGTCSATSDPVYKRGADMTGGQVFSVSPAEVSKLFDLFEPQLAGRRLTTAVTSQLSLATQAQGVAIPVDASASRLVISLAGSDTSTFTSVSLRDPSGGLLTPGVALAAAATTTKITTLEHAVIITVENPPAGLWHVEMAGSGSVSVIARLEAGIQFHQFQLVKKNDVDIHGGYTVVSGLPVPGTSAIGEATLFGPVRSVTFKLIDQDGHNLREVDFRRNSEGADPDHYLGSFTLPAVPFRVAAIGEDQTGTSFERTYATLFTVMPIGVAVAGTSGGVIARGATTPTTFEVTNLGGLTSHFDVTASTTLGSISSVQPASLTLPPGGTGAVTVNLAIEADAAIGSAVELTLTAAQSPTVFNSAIAKLTVNQPPQLCDVNLDGQIDQRDISTIVGMRGLPVELGNPGDADRDGRITALDARQCVNRCTTGRCELPR